LNKFFSNHLTGFPNPKFNNNESVFNITWFLESASMLAISLAVSILLNSKNAGFSLTAVPINSTDLASA